MGDYQRDGYALVEGLMPAEVAQAFLKALKENIGPGAIPLSRVREHSYLLKRAAFEACGNHYKPLLFFLWGLTLTVSALIGRDLLLTYDLLSHLSRR